MKCPSSILLAAVMIVSAIAGCSVKEDRGGCPCRLYLDMTNVDMSVMSPLSLYVASVDGLVHGAGQEIMFRKKDCQYRWDMTARRCISILRLCMRKENLSEIRFE